MIFEVQMLAFMDGEIRRVNVPDSEVTGNVPLDLERIFYYGQNHFQPVKGRCSVSVGDVVKVYGKDYICLNVGWALITPEQLNEYKRIHRRDRSFSKYINLRRLS